MQTMMGISSVANGGGAIQQPSPAGTKRKADETNLSDDLRFAKRFNLLNIDVAEPNRNSNFYIPVPQNPSPVPIHEHLSNNEDDGLMQVDDTRDRIYIRDLDAELADDEAAEAEQEKLIFLPDIERYFSKIPHQVLQGRKEDDDNEGKELVLYTIPRSLAVDEEHDNVRKAIIESRQRAREKAAEEARQLDMNCKYDQRSQHESAFLAIPTETAHGYSSGYEDEEAAAGTEDVDMMDMD